MSPVDSLDPIIPTVQAAFKKVSKGIVGFVGGVDVNASLAERVRVGQDIVWGNPIVGEPSDAVPACTGPCDGTLGATAHLIKIERQRHVPIPITGDQFKAMQGNVYPFLQEAFESAITKLVTEMDQYLAGKLLTQASRAWSSKNGVPFSVADNMTDFAGLKKVFRENKINPDLNNLRLIVNPTAMYNIEGKMSNLWHANEFGSDELSRFGKITTIQGFALGSTPDLQEAETGSPVGYFTNGAHAAGVTEIAIDTGTGTIKPGDSIVFGVYEDYYIAQNELTGTGMLKIAEPGLVRDFPDNTDISVLDYPTYGVSYVKEAVKFLARPPAVPEGGDAAVDTMGFRDPVSGLVIEVALYKQYLRQAYDVRIAYGAGVVDPAAVVLLLGGS